MKLSDTALTVLNGAAGRDDRLVPRRTDAPPVVDVNACRALVKQGVLEVVRAPLDAADIVTVREDDCPLGFVIADAGFRVLNLDPPGSAETAATGAPAAPCVMTDGDAGHKSAGGDNAVADAPAVPHAASDDSVAQEALPMPTPSTPQP
jgi:hypothetical protein